MTTAEAVARYYDGWQNKAGDLSDVPLADEFVFTGPVVSLDTADARRLLSGLEA